MWSKRHTIESGATADEIWGGVRLGSVGASSGFEVAPPPVRRRRLFPRVAVRNALRRGSPARPYQLELGGPILIRYSGDGDQPALERLAMLDSRPMPAGSFLLAEVDGELVAAVPLDSNDEPLSDPFRPTANLRELLRLQAAHVGRHRGAAALPIEPAPLAQRAAA